MPAHNVLLSTTYLGPVEWYAAMQRARRCIIDQHEHYVKQTYRNRCRILMPDGPQDLVVPVEKADSTRMPIRDLRLSDHGNWQHHHWNALRTAYGKTPFFDYYADDFYPFYHKPFTFLFDFNEQLRQLICQLIDIQPQVELSEHYLRETDGLDLRTAINPRQSASVLPDFKPRPYYQVFTSMQDGTFQPNLSIVDVLFNMGPETILSL